VRAWLRLGQIVHVWGAEARSATLKAVVAWGLPMMFCVPLFSRDVYAYIGQGRLMVEGFNPYENGISALSNYFQLGADKMWTEAPVPYGQLFLWIEQLVVWSTNVQPEASVMLFRLVAVAGVILCVIYVPKLAELHGINPHRALWLTAANPLFLTNFIASVHNDALMIGLALAGLYYSATRRAIRGIVLVTLSIAVKPITIVFLPFIGLLWAGRDEPGPADPHGPGQRLRFWLDQRALRPRQHLHLVRARRAHRNGGGLAGQLLRLRRIRAGRLGFQCRKAAGCGCRLLADFPGRL
jgi:alpha-1,6-mannosyltransferase